jgi:hypothetical protein
VISLISQILNGHSPTGAGQKIGIPAFSSFRPSDVADFLALSGLPANLIGQVSQVQVNGGAPLGPDQGDVLLAIDTILTIAPGATIVVYDAPFAGAGTTFQTLFNAMINDGVTIISNSFSYCEDQATLADVQSIDAILATAAASGITVFNATGDAGNACRDGSPNTVAVPASSPHATAVGGTTLKVGPGLTYAGEAWWDGSGQIPPTGQGGFGVSRFFNRPAYQNGLIASPMRSVPDVAAPANPELGATICEADAGGCPTGLAYGGTSLATPFWAAFTALLNERAGQSLGFLNPLLYPLANGSAFHSAASMGTDPAHVGLGSLNMNLLELAVANITPGPADPTRSLLTPFSSPDPRVPFLGTVPADGSSAASIVVQLRDANNDTVVGKTVMLSPGPGSHAVITPASGVSTVDNGAVVFTATDATIEDVTFTATADGVTLNQTATISFIGPPPTAAGISANPTSVPTSFSSTITVLLQDAQGHGVPGKLIQLSQGSGHAIVTGPNPPVTDSNGRVQFIATDGTVETVTFTAVDATDGIAIPGSAQVSYTGFGGPPCGGVATVAPGYALTDFATGFNTAGGCVGPIGLAFDASGNLIVGDPANGLLYKFGPNGGVATTAINSTPIGATLLGLTFSKDGRLYGVRRAVGDVVEINPTTGAVIRVVASVSGGENGIATDPISGDLFVTTSFGGLWRISGFSSGPGTATQYTGLDDNDGIVFAPDGTLFVAGINGEVWSISGTGGPTPPIVTVLATLPGRPDGIALAANVANPGRPPFLFVNRNDGTLSKVDLTQSPPIVSNVFTGGSRGDFVAVGPDGCAYATQTDRVLKVTNADGSCPFAPTSAAPGLSLTPAVVVPNPTQGTPETFTATFHNITVPAGTPVTLTVIGPNLQSRLGRTDANGQATFTYTGTFTGTDALFATATVSSQTLTSNVAQVTWTGGPHTTFLTLNPSPTGGTVGKPVTLLASLTDVSVTPAAVIPNANVNFTLGDLTCGGITDGNGIASCTVIPDAAGLSTLTAVFGGTPQYLGSTASTGFLVPVAVRAAGPPNISVASDGNLTRAGDAFTVEVVIRNAGGSDADNVTITAVRPIPPVTYIGPAVPINEGSVPAGSSATQALQFDVTGVATGAKVPFVVRGSYNDASGKAFAFNAIISVTLIAP